MARGCSMECYVCGKCKIEQKYIGEKCFACDGCKRVVCEKCAEANFTSTEIRSLQLKKGRKLCFYCSKCTGILAEGKSIASSAVATVREEILKIRKEERELYKERIENYEAQIHKLLEVNSGLQKMIEKVMTIHSDGNKKLENEIVELQNRVTEVTNITLSQTNTEINSYSQAVKQDFIVVKPKDKAQKSSVTKKDVEDKISPVELGLGISKVKHVQKGGIAIKCSKEGMPIENICTSIEDKLGDQYEVKKLEKKNPRIKIFNVYKKDITDEAEFLEKISKQNSLENTTGNKVLHKYETKDERFFNVIMEINKHTLVELNKKETLNIGWKMCRFNDYINIVQCNRCYRYGHIRKYCRAEREVCNLCAGNHSGSECKSNSEICCNCKYAAEVLKIPKIDFHHNAKDRNCAVFKRMYKEQQLKTDYPEFYKIHASA